MIECILIRGIRRIHLGLHQDKCSPSKQVAFISDRKRPWWRLYLLATHIKHFQMNQLLKNKKTWWHVKMASWGSCALAHFNKVKCLSSFWPLFYHAFESSQLGNFVKTRQHCGFMGVYSLLFITETYSNH